MLSLNGTEIEFDDPSGREQFILVDPITFAMFNASVDFSGRNWRRIKRELNKAADKARIAMREAAE